jgi:predicted DNA-binding transcriptional regulator YafY
VTLGLLAARRLGLATAAPATEGALAKIERVLPLEVGRRIRALEETISFTQRAAMPAPAATEVLLTLSFAAQYQRSVWLRYQDAAGAETEREFNPYGLVFHYGRWYLIGHDHRSGEVRCFRVDRVQAVEERDGVFERPRDFDAVEHLSRMLASLPWGFEIEVLLWATLAEARSWFSSHANLEETPEGVILRTQVEDVGMAARYLVGMCWDFEIVRPPELRDEVRRLASEFIERLDRSQGDRNPPLT